MNGRPVPEGFRVLDIGGGFIVANGPLYLRHEKRDELPALVQLGFRVEERHCNLMGILHGGMMASFCDMVLPLSAHRKSDEVGWRFLPTISLQIDYLAPVALGAWVQGEADILRVTRTLVFAQCLVTADGTPAARASGIMKIGQPFPVKNEVVG